MISKTRFFAFFERIAAASGLTANGPLQLERMTTAVFGIITALSTVSLVPSLLLDLRMDDMFSAAVHLGAYTGGAVAAFCRHLPVQTRIRIGLGAVIMVGTYNLAVFGLPSSGRIYLYSAPVFGGILLGVRTTLVITALNIVIMSGLGLSMHYGLLPWPPAHTALGWFITSATFLFLSSLAALCVTLILRDLEHQLALRRQSEKQLQNLLQEKEVLLREVHQRVKNNLQVIVSLLNLQSNHAQDPSSAKILKENRARIASMAAVHERLYKRDDLRRVEVSGYLSDICRDVVRSVYVGESPPSCKVHNPDIMVNVDTAVSLGLLVTELAINSCKHAFSHRSGNRIDIHAYATGDRFELRYCDNGVGLPEGLNVADPETLGLTIVNALVEQLEGSLRAPKNGDGACFQVSIPLVGALQVTGLPPGHRHPA